MNDDAMRPKLMELVDFILSEPAEVDLGDICAYVKYDLGVADDREVKRLTYEAVREMLRRRTGGFRRRRHSDGQASSGKNA